MSESNPVLVGTMDGYGFPNVYVYEHRGVRFGVHKTWRSSPAGWLASERDDEGWRGEQFTTGRSLPQSRKAAVAVAVDEINYRLDFGSYEVEDTGCTSGHWGSRAMACDRDGATQRDGFWLCDAHAADHDALVLEAQRDAERAQRRELAFEALRRWEEKFETKPESNLDPLPWTDGTDSRSAYRSGNWDVFAPRPEFAVNGNRALQAVADGVDTVDSMLEYLQDGFGATARNDGLFEPDEIAEAVEVLRAIKKEVGE